MTKRGPLKTLNTAFEVIEILWKEDGATAAEVADTLDMPRSTIHEYLRTLVYNGYALNSRGEYRLSTKFLLIGSRLKHRMGLFQVARPELEGIARSTGENANLAIEENGEAVVIHHVRGPEGLEIGAFPGIRTPSHAHATGKALLSLLSDERIDEIIDDRGLKKFTEHTITDRRELLDEIDNVRELGYACDMDEKIHGMGVVAAPIDNMSTGPAAISIVGSTQRFRRPEYVAELAEVVKSSADLIRMNVNWGE